MTHGDREYPRGGEGGGYINRAGVYTGGSSFPNSNPRRRRHSTGSTTTNAGFCSVFISIVLFLVCLAEMKPRTRICLTWFWVVVSAVITGTVLGTHYFSSQTLDGSPTDMRILDNISPTLCDGVTINSTSPVDQYIYHSYPKIEQDVGLAYTKAYQVIAMDNYKYWGFYLLEGSVASVDICANTFLDFYIIKGKTHLEEWEKDPDCSDCYIKYESVPTCYYDQTTEIFTASDTDKYYFLFLNYDESATLNVKFSLKRKVYNLKEADFSCSSQLCTTPLDIGSQESVVIFVPESSPSDVTLIVKCHPRIWFVILAFVVIPTATGLGVSCVVHKYYHRRTLQRTRRDSQIFIVSNNADELHGVIDESYPGAPPSYVEFPPTYEEAISSNA